MKNNRRIRGDVVFSLVSWSSERRAAVLVGVAEVLRVWSLRGDSARVSTMRVAPLMMVFVVFGNAAMFSLQLPSVVRLFGNVLFSVF